MNTHELAWAAGFFDGEGCTTYAASNRGSYRLKLIQTGTECLERFQCAVGGLGRIRGPVQTTKYQKDTYVWEALSFEEAQAVGAMLWNFLSEPKQDQLAFQAKNYLRNGRPKRSKYHKSTKGRFNEAGVFVPNGS